jgi:hypothetical protein
VIGRREAVNLRAPSGRGIVCRVDISSRAIRVDQRAVARVNGSTRLTLAAAAATTTGAGTFLIVIARDGPVCAWAFDSIAHPEERRPQWMHRRKIVPG